MGTIRLEGNRGYIINESGASAISNTTAEMSLFSTTIPAFKMGNSKILKFELTCQLTTPALSIPTLTLKLRFGTFTLTLATSATISASLTEKPLLIEGKIMNLTTGTQYIVVKIFNNTSGVNILSGLGRAIVVLDSNCSIDTTVDQVFNITSQFGGLSGTASITPKIVEINLT